MFDCRLVGGELRPQPDETRALRYLASADFPPLILPFPPEIWLPRDDPGAFFQDIYIAVSRLFGRLEQHATHFAA